MVMLRPFAKYADQGIMGMAQKRILVDRKQHKEVGESPPPSPPPSPITPTGKPLFAREILIPLYFLVTIGLLFFNAYDYYSLISPYLDYGGDEALITFGAFCVVLYYLGARFFFLYVDRAKKITHVLAIFLMPTTFFELSLQTYMNEAQAFTSFDSWFFYYKEGALALKKQEDKLAYKLFQQSLAGQDETLTNSRYLLFFKSRVALFLIEKKYAKKDDLEKLFEKGKKLWNRYPLSMEPTDELFGLTVSLIEIARNLSNNERQLFYYNYLGKLFKHGYQLSSLPASLVIKWQFEEVMVEWSGVLKKSRLLREEDVEGFSEESLVKWKKYLSYAGEVFRNSKIQNEKEQILRSLFQALSYLHENNMDDLSLDSYISVLSFLRNSPFQEELYAVYEAIISIYLKKGFTQKAKVYQELLKQKE